MGHGFYQFSPELFFRVFSTERGFALRKLILFDTSKIDAQFYEVRDPATTAERSASPPGPVQMMVLAQKIAETPRTLEPPQQSDYLALWRKHDQRTKTDGVRQPASAGLVRRLRLALNPYWPTWLRDGRDTLRHHKNWLVSRRMSQLDNPRFFHSLSNAEIFKERSKPVSVDPKV